MTLPLCFRLVIMFIHACVLPVSILNDFPVDFTKLYCCCLNLTHKRHHDIFRFGEFIDVVAHCSHGFIHGGHILAHTTH